MTVRSPSNGPPDILFIGIGSGKPDPTYFNQPANSVAFWIYQGWMGGEVIVAGHPTGLTVYNPRSIGTLPADSGTEFTEFTARITKISRK